MESRMTAPQIGSIWKIKWATREYEEHNFKAFLILHCEKRSENVFWCILLYLDGTIKERILDLFFDVYEPFPGDMNRW